MDFNEYQTRARGTAIYPGKGSSCTYPTLGLCGEAGEVAEKVKKVIRDYGGLFSVEKVEEISLELGDVLWYIANICCELGLSLEEVAQLNVDKLAERQKSNKLHGEGDNR
jgi:NTP pyrophosphatase (non-canonical NTP hydrolase)